MDKIKSFKELKMWQNGLISQMKRSAISIPFNIAEGFKRYHDKEYSQFLHIVLDSATELETQLIIAREIGFIGKNKLDEFSEKINHLSKMVSSLFKKLK